MAVNMLATLKKNKILFLFFFLICCVEFIIAQKLHNIYIEAIFGRKVFATESTINFYYYYETASNRTLLRLIHVSTEVT